MRDPRRPPRRMATGWALRLSTADEVGSPVQAWLFYLALVLFPLWLGAVRLCFLLTIFIAPPHYPRHVHALLAALPPPLASAAALLSILSPDPSLFFLMYIYVENTHPPHHTTHTPASQS
ncbi:hypothetical protein BC827DRAFT_1249960, partial [Russula dissimulans]